MTFALPMTFLQAISRMEGFYAPGSRPNRNNNPGDVEYGKFSIAHGATHGDPRFAVFPNEAAGYSAMRALFEAPAYKGLTITEALDKWAPPVENRTNAYITNVCEWTELSPDTIIDTVLAA